MRSVVDDLGQTVVMVTHDPGAAAYADRVVFLVDGTIVHELRDPTKDGVLATAVKRQHEPRAEWPENSSSTR